MLFTSFSFLPFLLRRCYCVWTGVCVFCCLLFTKVQQDGSAPCVEQANNSRFTFVQLPARRADVLAYNIDIAQTATPQFHEFREQLDRPVNMEGLVSFEFTDSYAVVVRAISPCFCLP